MIGVRGYGDGDGRMTIHRLGWKTKYDLSRLRSAEVLAAGLPGSRLPVTPDSPGDFAAAVRLQSAYQATTD